MYISSTLLYHSTSYLSKKRELQSNNLFKCRMKDGRITRREFCKRTWTIFDILEELSIIENCLRENGYLKEIYGREKRFTEWINYAQGKLKLNLCIRKFRNHWKILFLQLSSVLLFVITFFSRQRKILSTSVDHILVCMWSTLYWPNIQMFIKTNKRTLSSQLSMPFPSTDMVLFSFCDLF